MPVSGASTGSKLRKIIIIPTKKPTKNRGLQIYFLTISFKN
nr:MAG TPA: hypothetical protein [Caudoviricetes sp.]